MCVYVVGHRLGVPVAAGVHCTQCNCSLPVGNVEVSSPVATEVGTGRILCVGQQ